MTERFQNVPKISQETEFFRDLDLDQVFNHFGEFPEADPARRAAVDDIFNTRTERPYKNEALPKTTTAAEFTAILKKRKAEEAAASRAEYTELVERLIVADLLTEEDLPEAVEARGDQYEYLYNGDDFITKNECTFIAPLGPLYTRALHREQFKLAEIYVAEAVARLAAYGIMAKPPRFRWTYFTSQYKGRIGRTNDGRRRKERSTDTPVDRLGMSSEQYAYPVRIYPNTGENHLYAVKQDVFTWLAKDVLKLNDTPFINQQVRFGTVERQRPLDPVQDFFYRIARAFEIESRKGSRVTVEEWQKIRLAFPDSKPPVQSVAYRELKNPFDPLLAILQTGLCPLGFSKDQFYCFIVQCDKY